MNGFREKAFGVRTHARTDATPKVSNDFIERPIKKIKIIDEKNVSPFQRARWPNLGKICVNFGQKGPFFKFPKKVKTKFSFDSRDYASSKKK